MAAYSIAAREALGMKRQIFFIDYGGWDNHDEVLVTQQGLLYELDAAFGEFSDAMTEIGLSNQVTTYFDGGGFNATTEYFNLASWSGANPWTYNAVIPYASSLKYLFRSYAVDLSSNAETSLAPQISVFFDNKLRTPQG